MQFDAQKRELRLSVGEVVRHGAESVIRVSSAAATRMALGSAEHGVRRGELESVTAEEDFHAEVPIVHRERVRDCDVALEGRIDGLRREGDRWIVEEVKTVILAEDAFTDMLSRSQLEESVREGDAYADYRLQLCLYLLAAARGGIQQESVAVDGEARGALRARLVLRNLAACESGARELAIDLDVDLEATRQDLLARLEEILEGFLREEVRRERLARACEALPFAFESYRPGQRELEDVAGAAFRKGRQLLLQAPPGVGKTAAVLRAALDVALPQGRRVFWLTSRTTQQRLVASTLEAMAGKFAAAWREQGGAQDPPFRVSVLRAREKMCPTLAAGRAIFCHDRYCDHAADYSRKLREHGLLERLAVEAVRHPETIYEEADAATACPFEVSLDLVASAAVDADVIVGDTNYVFDPGSALRRFDLESLVAGALLVVDEAHHLYSRVRESYGASLAVDTVAAALADVERHGDAHQRELFELCHRAGEALTEIGHAVAARDGEASVAVESDIFRELLAALQPLRAARVVRRRLAESRGATDPVETFALELRRLVDAFDRAEAGVRTVALAEKRGGATTLRLACVDPASMCGERLASFHGVVAMSATLEPVDFFADVLGVDPRRREVWKAPSPFPRRNRLVVIDTSVRTTYRHRGADAEKVARRIDEIVSARAGNYLVFFSSFRYLEQVLAHVDATRIGDDVLVQRRRMSEPERDAVLARLREPDSSCTLFAVQGGIFAEGIDYPGGMAIGVIVVGPGLPRFGAEEESLRAYFDERYEKGFEYAYLYPGMQRVVQAAGRLIRSATDAGAVVLLGERFARPPYSSLLPEDWYDASPRDLVSPDPAATLREFWSARESPT